MKIFFKKLFALLRMKYLFCREYVFYILSLINKKGCKFARRHAHLCRNVYEPWLEQKIKVFFDRDYYIERYVKGPIIVDPFKHYLRRGIYNDLAPNSYFSPLHYRVTHMPLKSRLFPILHYAIHQPKKSDPGIHTCQNNYELANNFRLIELLSLCRRYQLDICPQSKVLDFGCGCGDTVGEMRALGWNWYGYDIVLRLSEKAKNYASFFKFEDGFIDKENERHNITNYRLKEKDYRIPFDDNIFDFVISHQVLEHVFNLEETHKELMRILKPGGTAIHIYPPKECFMERHYSIPLGHRLHYKLYFDLWSLLGFCGRHHQSMHWRDRSEHGFTYISTATNYTTIEQMRHISEKFFSNVRIEPYSFSHYSLNILHTVWRRIFPREVILLCRKG